MRIATSRYHAPEVKVAVEGGWIALGVTVGGARWLGYELAGNVGPLAPWGLRKIEDKTKFEVAYRRRLDDFGFENIHNLLESYAQAYGAAGIVLLCFENLHEPGEWCHRRTFAEWWKEHTDEDVLELDEAFRLAERDA